LCGAVIVAPHIRNLGKVGPSPPLEDERALPSTGEAKINAACALPHCDLYVKYISPSIFTGRAAQILLRVGSTIASAFAARSATIRRLNHCDTGWVAIAREPHYLEPAAPSS